MCIYIYIHMYTYMRYSVLCYIVLYCIMLTYVVLYHITIYYIVVQCLHGNSLIKELDKSVAEARNMIQYDMV